MVWVCQWVPLAVAGALSHPSCPGRVSGEEWAPGSAAIWARGSSEGGVETAPPLFTAVFLLASSLFLFTVLIVWTSCCCHPPWLG